VLGVPASPGTVGWLLLAFGSVGAVVAVFALRRRVAVAPAATAAALVALVVAVAALPFVVWRFVEDLRVTTRLDGYGAEEAGPVQAYLPGYLVNGARRVIPVDATFATAVSQRIPWAPARAAFPSLTMQTLFPGVSVEDPGAADYVVSWGVRPAVVTPVIRTWIVRARAGAYPAVYVGQVAK
jgi:hypothetical protein